MDNKEAKAENDGVNNMAMQVDRRKEPRSQRRKKMQLYRVPDSTDPQR
jgi:hypothetical protein